MNSRESKQKLNWKTGEQKKKKKLSRGTFVACHNKSGCV
jgi:hypothetical protein